jgi:putative nucleotidyltransferase with HDIG domain
MRIKVEVQDLALGMFVAELDRPWLESPFLFQGFTIESDEELRQLREVCKWVWIDDLKSEAKVDFRALRAAMPRPAVKPTLAVKITYDARKVQPEVFKQDVKQAAAVQAVAEKKVEAFLDSARSGKALDTDQAKGVVNELVGSITQNPHTALWLTSLKRKQQWAANHCMNVSILAIAFAKHLGLPDDQVEAIGLGAMLHDVGLSRTPNSILEKPGPLTPEEMQAVRRHPLDGHTVLKLTKNLPEVALEIVRHHHERVDGTGYPDKLSGDAVSVPVRVVAIADAYDSMVSERPWRAPSLPQPALTALHRDSEGHFGKQLAEEFIKCVGIYPIGSLVQLSTGALAIVMSSNPENRLKPLVLMVKDDDGRSLMPRQMVNLATIAQQKAADPWTITMVVNPRDHGVDVSAIVADELSR